MAGGQERILRGRIRGIESTKKITRAFELIAASQIVRAQARIAASKPYVGAITDILAETAADRGGAPSGSDAEPTRVLVLAVVADRGLCGAYNTNVLRATEREIAAQTEQGRSVTVVAVGRKAQSYFRFRSQPVEHQFTKISDRPSFEDARRVAAVVVTPFVAGEVDLVKVVSTRFVSAGTQLVEVRQLLPLETLVVDRASPGGGSTALVEAARESGETGAQAAAGEYGSPPEPKLGYFEFEPDAPRLLERLVPDYAEAAVYQALLEAAASEHTSRQRAMSAATENADELIKTYRRIMNRARQDSITTEIMEIVGGAEALRSAGGIPVDLSHPRATEEQIA